MFFCVISYLQRQFVLVPILVLIYSSLIYIFLREWLRQILSLQNLFLEYEVICTVDVETCKYISKCVSPLRLYWFIQNKCYSLVIRLCDDKFS